MLKLPRVLRIEPAASCNFHCIHCPTGLGLTPKGIMTTEDFDRIFEKLRGCRFAVGVLYHGGEPLLNKQFCHMVKRLKSIADKVKTVSNGSMLSEELSVKILDSGLDEIEFSLDGTSVEENNKIRVGCDFDKVVSNIKYLITLREKMQLTGPRVFISNTQVPPNNQPGPVAVPEYLLRVFDGFNQHMTYKPTWALIWPGTPVQIAPTKPGLNYCDHVVSAITIRWNGDVVPCCYDLNSEMGMGNLLKESIEEIWGGTGYQNLRSDIEGFNPPKLCLNCPVLFPGKRMTGDMLQF